MTELYQALAERVAEWRSNGYPCSYPAIAEILEYAVENEREGFRYPLSGNLRFLRQPQLRALETNWYLRLVHDTPRVGPLYADLFAKPSERRKALGLDGEVFADIIADDGIEGLLGRIEKDDAFVVEHQPEALREGLFLQGH